MTTKVIVDRIEQVVGEAYRVLVITHLAPDGDAIGSATAMGQALRQLGKQITLVCDGPIPERFSYLPLFEHLQTATEQNAQYDLIVALDCGDEQRMGQAYTSLPQPPTLINIDHHITNTNFGDINLVTPQATSTAEMLYSLFRHMNIKITNRMATSLLTGIVTDTLGFRTDGVTANTLKIAGELMEAGADLSLITMQGLKLKPVSTLQLWRIGLNNMKFEDGLAWATISNEERRAIGYTNASSAGLVNMLADIERAAMGVVMVEAGDDVSVGFRCNPPYDVSELAMNLGGGGHPLAAGCTLQGPLPKVESLVVKMSKEAIQRQSRP